MELVKGAAMVIGGYIAACYVVGFPTIVVVEWPRPLELLKEAVKNPAIPFCFGCAALMGLSIVAGFVLAAYNLLR